MIYLCSHKVMAFFFNQDFHYFNSFKNMLLELEVINDQDGEWWITNRNKTKALSHLKEGNKKAGKMSKKAEEYPKTIGEIALK